MEIELVKKYFPNASPSFIRRNMGGLQTDQPKPTAAQTLERSGKKLEAGKSSVAIRISFVAFSRRDMDSDNIVGACKSLRDAICESIGVDDGDKMLTFEYGQVLTRGSEGVFVKISLC